MERLGSALLSAALLIIISCRGVHSQTTISSTIGLDFDIGFMKGFFGETLGFSTLRLQIGTSSLIANYAVTDRDGAVIASGIVTSIGPVTVSVADTLYQVVGSDFSERNKGIHVSSSDNPIFVVVENFLNFNHGTYLAYPQIKTASDSSYEYYVISADDLADSTDRFVSEFLLIGSENNTRISFIPTQDVSIPLDTQSPTSPRTTVTAGSSSPVLELNRLQTLLVSSVDDLTGTRILSNKPLSVISGHQCANIPSGASGCEPLAFQSPPVSTWGDRFFLAPFAGRDTQQKFRIISAEPATITYTCGDTTLSVDDATDLVVNTQEYCFLASSSPAMVVQLSLVDSMGDPAIALVSPIEQYISETTFVTLPADRFPTSYISVTVRAEDFTNTGILLDNAPLNCAWESILLPDDVVVGYGCNHSISGAVNPTYHTVSHVEGGLVSVLVYGFRATPDLGYAYLAGFSSMAIDVQCPALSTIDNGVLLYGIDGDRMAPFDFGTIATYSCAEGFYLSGASIRTCRGVTGEIGSWSGMEPSCDPIFCDALPDLENGNILYRVDDDIEGIAPYKLGTMATYFCDVGFNMIGESTRTCGHGIGTVGSWNGTEPICLEQPPTPPAFIDLTQLPGVKELDNTEDSVSPRIDIPKGFIFGDKIVTSAYVSENGVVSFEEPWRFSLPENFPTSNDPIAQSFVVAPFWSDNDIRKEGAVRYVSYSATENMEPEVNELFEMLNEFVQPNRSDVEIPFLGEWLLIAHWDQVHPSPHGAADRMGISEEVLNKTNSYQVSIISNIVTTFVLYSYDIQWSRVGAGRSAVVGYNAGGNFFSNHPLSGTPFIGCGVNGISCSTSSGSRRKRSEENPFRNECLPANETLKERAQSCSGFYNMDKILITNEMVENLISTLQTCPPTEQQAREDCGRFRPQGSDVATGDTQCYVTTKAVILNLDAGETLANKQCCYQEGNLITDNSRRLAGTMLLTAPGIFDDTNFRSSCCDSPDFDIYCDFYFERRPINTGPGYEKLQPGHGTGDPHFRTLDGRGYDFMGNGDYTLLEILSPNTDTSPVTILGRMDHIPGLHTGTTVHTGLAVGEQDLAFHLGKDGSFRVFQTRPTEEEVTQNLSNRPLDFNNRLSLRRAGNTLEVCHYDSGVKVTGQFFPRSGPYHYINVRVFVPRSHMERTRALFGNFDGSRQNEFIRRNGNSAGANPSFTAINNVFQTWQVPDSENFLLAPTNRRRKRQAEEFQPLSFEDLNITDAHREVCGDNVDCLYDFAASEDMALAMDTLQFGEETVSLEAMLDNLPPMISVLSTFRVQIAPAVWELEIAVVDPNEDSFTLSFQGGVVNAFVSELVSVSPGVYLYRLSVTDHSQLDLLEPLVFTATDEDGASSFAVPTLEICGCVNGGECTTDGVLTFDSTFILNCNCPEAYGGTFCEEDQDGCEEFQCFDGTTCSDVPAPGAGAVCSSCPPGYTGDSQKCFDIDECAADPTLCDQVCVNTDGGFMCTCNDGYLMDEVTGQCQDIDECAGVNDCQQQCINDEGSYSCACDSQFTLNSDGRTCTVSPEFSCSLSCDNGQCVVVNIDPRVEECSCDIGYHYETPNCVDTNECVQSPCEHECSNLIGSFSCSCLPGYSLQGDGRSCEDIDECFEAALGLNDLCESDPNTQCVNTEGFYQCQCVPGYFRSDGACVRNFCPSLGEFESGTISYSNFANAVGGFGPGTVATYSCNEPFTLIGSNIRECGEDRQWSGMEPSCELVMCEEELDAPLNGAIVYTGDDTPPYDVLTMATYSCFFGYRLFMGDVERTCVGVDDSSSLVGMWTGSSPSCEVIQCTALAVPDNTAIFYTKSADPDYPAGTTAIYMCSQGYYITAGDLFQSCLPDGSWTGTQAVCSALIPEGCPDIPDPENGNIKFVGDTTAPFTVGTMATYECATGYYMEGESVRVCEEGDMDSWSRTAPLCAPITCLPLLPPTNGAVEYEPESDDEGNYAFSTVATFSCSAGFGLVGSMMTSTCKGDGSSIFGTFYPTPPPCEPIICPPLESIFDGEISYDSLALEDGFLSYGTVATYSCQSGHILMGSATRICTGDGSSTLGYFSEEAPYCEEIICLALDVPQGGQIVYSSNSIAPTYDLGVTATYSCDDGYSLENGDVVRVCEHDGVSFSGEWSGRASECLGTCPLLSAPADGSVSYSMDPDENDEFLSGTIASFSCDEGFELFGEYTRMCQNNMTWTDSQPSCQIACSGLESIEFGSLSYSAGPNVNGSYAAGTIASYECDINYSLDGMESRQCEADMEWSGVAPVCEPIMCPDLPDPVHGNIVFKNDKTAPFELSTVAQYKCYYGYVLVGEYSLRSCFADNENDIGYWNATAPTCEPVTCPPLPLPDDNVAPIDYSLSVDAAGNYPYSTEASYSCVEGYYRVSGDEIRTCETSGGSTVGVWSGVEIVCEEIIARCPDIPNPKYGRVTFDHHSLAPFLRGTNATYSCDLGYGLDGGDEVRTCEMDGVSPDGVWSGMEPKCIAVITCPLLELPVSGNVSYSVDIETEGIGFRVTATYSCDHESLGVRGDRVRECKPGSHGHKYDHDRELIGVWTGWNPSCELIQCPDIADPINGQIVFTTDRRAPFDYGTRAEYSCEDGYSLSSGDETVRVCGGDGLTDVGVWFGEDYTCERGEILNGLSANVKKFSVVPSVSKSESALVVEFDQTSYELKEGSSVPVCVLISGSLDEGSVVNVTTLANTARGSGVDYHDINKQFTFTKSPDRVCLKISAIEDSVFEEEENLTITIIHLQGSKSVPVLITDNDQAQLSLSKSEDVCEGAGEVDVSVKLETAIEKDVVVLLETMDMSAKESQDFLKLSQFLTFKAPLPAQSVVTASVEILDDSEVEPCEQFMIELTPSSERTVVRGESQATVTINDDEGIKDFYLTKNSPQVHGTSLKAYYKLIGCSQVTCNVSYGTNNADCSPPVGSFNGYWYVPHSTPRETSQYLHMNIEPYCGQAPVFEKRMFRTDNKQCGVHFTGRQYEVDPTTGDVTIEWEGTGPNELNQVTEFLCELNKQGERFPCTSPYTLKGLSPGQHTFSVDPVPIEGCTRDVARSLKILIRS